MVSPLLEVRETRPAWTGVGLVVTAAILGAIAWAGWSVVSGFTTATVAAPAPTASIDQEAARGEVEPTPTETFDKSGVLSNDRGPAPTIGQIRRLISERGVDLFGYSPTCDVADFQPPHGSWYLPGNTGDDLEPAWRCWFAVIDGNPSSARHGYGGQLLLVAGGRVVAIDRLDGKGAIKLNHTIPVPDQR